MPSSDKTDLELLTALREQIKHLAPVMNIGTEVVRPCGEGHGVNDASLVLSVGERRVFIKLTMVE